MPCKRRNIVDEEEEEEEVVEAKKGLINPFSPP